MRFVAPLAALREAVKTAQQAIPAVTARTELSGVLLIAGATSCSAVASRNGETTIAAQLAITESEPGQVLLPAAALSAYLATFEPGESVTLSATDQTVAVRVGDHPPYHLRRILAPLPLPAAPEAPPVPVDFSRLGAALAAVRASVDRTTSAVQLVSSSAGLAVHTTDRYRLTRCVLPEAAFGDATLLLPLDVLEWLARSTITSVTLDPSSRSVRFAGAQVIVSTRLLAAPFPAVEPVLRSEPSYRARVSGADLSRSLQRLRTISRQAPVVAHFVGERLTLSATNDDLGWGEEHVALAVNTGPDTTVHVRPDFLADAVASIGSEMIDLAWSGAMEALRLSTVAPLAVTVLVMPTRAPGA